MCGLSRRIISFNRSWPSVLHLFFYTSRLPVDTPTLTCGPASCMARSSEREPRHSVVSFDPSGERRGGWSVVIVVHQGQKSLFMSHFLLGRLWRGRRRTRVAAGASSPGTGRPMSPATSFSWEEKGRHPSSAPLYFLLPFAQISPVSSP
jgi:hypothetical protein